MAVTHTYDALAALPAHYQRLFEAAEKYSPFFSREWFELLARTLLTPQHRLRIYAAESERGEAQALLVMNALPAANRNARAALFGLSNYYTPLFGPVINSAATYDSVKAALGAAIEDGPWDIIDFHPLDPAHPSFAWLESALRDAGYWLQTYFCFMNWYLEVKGRSFDDYCRSLPSALRHTLKRKSNQLRAKHAVRCVITTGMDELDQAINAYEAVYAASWKPAEEHAAFLPNLIRLAAGNGSLRLAVLYVDEKPVATQLWIVAHGRASIYKLAHDSGYSQWSVGSQLSLALMEHVLECDRVSEVDFLTGDDSYKKDWMSHARERWGIVAFNPRRPHGLLAAARNIGGRKLKSGINRVLGRGR